MSESAAGKVFPRAVTYALGGIVMHFTTPAIWAIALTGSVAVAILLMTAVGGRNLLRNDKSQK